MAKTKKKGEEGNPGGKDNSPEKENSSEFSIGTIIAIIFGSFFFLCCLVCLICYCVRKRRGTTKENELKISNAHLPKGVYIIELNKRIQKLIVKEKIL